MKNRTILITGATGALGNHVAKTFAAQGHSLALLDSNAEKLDGLVRDLNLPKERLYAQAIDLLDASAVRASAEAVTTHFGAVHALIHLVGGWTGGRTIQDTSAEELTSMLNQHVWTTFNLFKSYVPHLIASGWGRVITLSLPLTVHPEPKLSAHSAGKAAQESLVMTLAEETLNQGITANIIHIQGIDTKGDGKGATPAEIVAAMLYLCSDEASQVTGVRLPIYR